MTKPECDHKGGIKDVTAVDPSVCEDCLKTGDTWVSLRMCLSCGHVSCCNSSKNKHATEHFKATGHTIIKSVSSGEEFMWCYIDEIYLK